MGTKIKWSGSLTSNVPLAIKTIYAEPLFHISHKLTKKSGLLRVPEATLRLSKVLAFQFLSLPKPTFHVMVGLVANLLSSNLSYFLAISLYLSFTLFIIDFRFESNASSSDKSA